MHNWQDHLLNPDSSVDVDAITDTVEGVLDQIADQGPESINLKEILSQPFQLEHLAAVLRVSSAWRNAIPDWDYALLVVECAIISAGLDPQDLLFGMIPNHE